MRPQWLSSFVAKTIEAKRQVLYDDTGPLDCDSILVNYEDCTIAKFQEDEADSVWERTMAQARTPGSF